MGNVGAHSSIVETLWGASNKWLSFQESLATCDNIKSHLVTGKGESFGATHIAVPRKVRTIKELAMACW